jgi:tRNA(Ile2) C34 agmatinyltransferase TiaS
MTLTVKTNEETIVKTKVSDIRKGDIVAYTQDTTKKVRIINIKFDTWNNKNVAFIDFIELDTLKARYYQFIDCNVEFLKVLGYESLEERSLRCENCSKQLGKATFKGIISLKCPKCKTMNDFTN